MTTLLDTIRFPAEGQLILELFDRFGLEAIIDHYEASGQAGAHYEMVMSTQLRLTPILAPRLCSILEEVSERLDFREPIELFVEADAGVNAFALHSLSKDTPHVVSLTSGMVERMTDDELRFAMGHELGHLAYRHYRAMLVYHAVGQDADGEPRLPPLLAVRLESWTRLAELSADRAGFAAVHGKLDTIVSAFFKLASGLGPEHLRFDISAFLHQLEDLQKMKRKEVLANFSHPVTPVRVRALQLWGEVWKSKRKAKLKKVNAEVDELSRLLDYEVTEPLEVHARDFLMAGGLLAAYSDDEEVTDEQWKLLVQLLVPLTSDPEAQLQRVSTREAAEQMLTENAAWLRENAGQERFLLFRQLAHIIAVDGRLHPGEHDLMLSVARQLGIPDKAANETLFEVLAGYLQTKAEMRPRFVGFGPRDRVEVSKMAESPPMPEVEGKE
jgi:hypothetical protein